MVEVDDDELFAEFQRNPRRSVRNQIVERHLGLAVHIARRFSPSTIGDEDLQQVAMLALVKAVDRYDPTIGSAFSAFAGRTIEGEIKRHFRDKTWSVRVPRSAKELHLAVRRANDELTQRLGRSPSVPEVAEHLGISRDDVITGLSAAAARSVGSIDASTTDDDTAIDRREAMADVETGFAQDRRRTGRARCCSRCCPSASARSCGSGSTRTCRRPRSRNAAGSPRCTSRDSCDDRSTRCDTTSTSE